MTIPTWDVSWNIAERLVGIGFCVYFVVILWIWMFRDIIKDWKDAFGKPQTTTKENNNASDSNSR